MSDQPTDQQPAAPEVDTEHKPGDVIPEGLVIAVLPDQGDGIDRYTVADLSQFGTTVERTHDAGAPSPE